MSRKEAFEEARGALRVWVEEVSGAGPVPRLDEALTHPSFANESRVADNQRLEFLGDAVLGLCVSEQLSFDHPDADEGELTRMRASLVNSEALARWAREVKLGDCLALGRGARSASERDQTNVLADAVEAVVAAVYEAGGMASARELVREIVRGAGALSPRLGARDPKSELQERVQAEGREAPRYNVVASSGPPHEPTFEVEVVVGDDVLARGEGRSKRLAERDAAARALEAIDAS